jgi:peptide deformylase
MALLQILRHPDPRLRQKAKPVLQFDQALTTLVDNMFETMYAAPGIGLAAVQVNVLQRVIVLDISANQTQPLHLVNPVISTVAGKQEISEGCLSVPGVYETVRRAERIVVTAQNRAGERFELEAEDLLAVCIQHEIDHLEGKLFVDYLTQLKQSRIRKKIEKERKLAR